MKKALSLLLALTLVFAMAAPASAAYTGRFSRDGTYNDIAYLISASCTTNTARASVSYADPSATVELRLTINCSNGSGGTYWSGEQTGYYVMSRETNYPITDIAATFKILGAQIASVTVNPS